MSKSDKPIGGSPIEVEYRYFDGLGNECALVVPKGIDSDETIKEALRDFRKASRADKYSTTREAAARVREAISKKLELSKEPSTSPSVDGKVEKVVVPAIGPKAKL